MTDSDYWGIPPIDAGLSTAAIAAVDIERVVQNLHTEYTAFRPRLIFSRRIYQMIRWFAHLGKVHPEPRRKLRKCQLRKRYRVLRRARRRYL